LPFSLVFPFLAWLPPSSGKKRRDADHLLDCRPRADRPGRVLVGAGELRGGHEANFGEDSGAGLEDVVRLRQAHLPLRRALRHHVPLHGRRGLWQTHPLHVPRGHQKPLPVSVYVYVESSLWGRAFGADTIPPSPPLLPSLAALRPAFTFLCLSKLPSPKTATAGALLSPTQ
jgi:hypothetical protein